MAYAVRPDMADFLLEVCKHNIPYHSAVNKFGRNPDVDTATDPEDVWDVGGIWVPPTQARIHNLASSSADDASAGTGMRTVKVYGLTSWDTPEVNETVILNGVSAVATVNSYVIVHRMHGVTFGSGGLNAGTISATAVTDATVTAQISIGKGQTLMAIYGIPSGKTLYMYQWRAGMNRTGGAASSSDVELFVKSNADQADAGWTVKEHEGLVSTGISRFNLPFEPRFGVNGPAIVKVQVENVTANDTDISAGFHGVLVGI